MMRDLLASPLVRVLADPRCIPEFTDKDWDLTIRQGRAAGLLGTIYYVSRQAGTLDQIPERPLIHLSSAHRVAERHKEVTLWEVKELYALMERIGVPMIVLKGAAYVVANLEAAKGRLFGDIDIMVPRGALGDVEDALGRAGWVQENQNAYDDRYYRKWMHEIPARRHFQRGMVLDVHHNILPLTARHKPNTKALWDADLRIPGFDDLYVLSKEDMVLHTASHLFCNGEFDRGLRDLFDFYRLAMEFSTDHGFWKRLADRATEMDLAIPLRHAMHNANQILNASLPMDILSGIPVPVNRLIDSILLRGLLPNHSTTQDFWSPTATFFLFVRGHYLRMPLHLLIPHLLYKATLAKLRDEKIYNERQRKLEELRAFLGK